MKLKSEFIRLPFQFDQLRLKQEVEQFKDVDWMTHPSNIAGNFSLPLISAHGERNDLMSGEMLATEHLQQSPYIKQIMETLGEIYGRSRLMLLKAGCQVTPHYDLHYHWYNRVRIHIPIITNPGVIFRCADTSIHMKAGETWIFDSWQKHSVFNNSNHDRVHLVLDTCGSFSFWKMVEQFLKTPIDTDLKVTPYLSENKNYLIKMEKFNVNDIMSAGEVDFFINLLVDDVAKNIKNDPVHISDYLDTLNQFKIEWRNTWLQYGNDLNSREKYQQLILNAEVKDKGLTLHSNGCDAKAAFYALLLGVAINEQAIKKAIQKDSVHNGNQSPNKPPVISSSPPRRNSLCSCGSNKKFKYCCGQ